MVLTTDQERTLYRVFVAPNLVTKEDHDALRALVGSLSTRHAHRSHMDAQSLAAKRMPPR